MYWPYIIVLLRKSSRLFCADILIYSKVGLFRDGKHGLNPTLSLRGKSGSYESWKAWAQILNHVWPTGAMEYWAGLL